MSHRPLGFDGSLSLEGSGRDLWTGWDEAGVVLHEARYDAVVDHQRHLQSLVTHPAADLDRLLPLRVSPGFRLALEDVLPDEREAGSLLYLLLDELPVASLVANYPVAQAGRSISDVASLANIDICAGYRRGGTMAELIAAIGTPQPAFGPPAPSLLSGDPLAWHALPPLVAHAMCRFRRLDLWADGPILKFDILFRDSYMSPAGEETVVHEYLMDGSVDGPSLTIQDIRADPRVLPFPECPAAAGSPQRMIGSSVLGLRALVRQHLVGATTCTHLNDVVRSLEDVAPLARHLAEAQERE